MPRMPLIGVRISWLMVARKRDLASFAASARSRAAAASFSLQTSSRNPSFSAATWAERSSAMRRERANAAASATARATATPACADTACAVKITMLAPDSIKGPDPSRPP